MKLLLDENLSYRVLKGIEDLFPGSAHVTMLGLTAVNDSTIWDYAKAQGMIIVTKDDDFHRMSMKHGHPPKVVWLDIGNCPTGTIVHLIRSHRQELVAFSSSEVASLLVLKR